MKTRDLLSGIWLGLVLVSVTLGLISLGILIENHQLRSERREARAQIDALTTQGTVLQQERDAIEEELRMQRRRVEELAVQVAERNLREEFKTPAVGQQAYRVRVFLENRAIGQGWLVPGRATTNAAGHSAYEPVVVLDPATRSAFAAAACKESVAAAPASVTVNHNYPYPYSASVWPAYWVWCTDAKPQPPQPPSNEVPRFPTLPRPQPQPESPFLSTRIWQPQTGYRQMAPGRPGGEWISSAPRGHSYLSGGTAIGTGRSTLPVRY